MSSYSEVREMQVLNACDVRKNMKNFKQYLWLLFKYRVYWLIEKFMGIISTYLKKRGIISFLWVLNTEKEFELALQVKNII